MTHETQMTRKDDGSLLTSGIRTRDFIIQLIVLEMQLHVVPRFVDGGKVVESNFVGFA